MRKLVSDFLTRDGYEVIEAGDGEEAVEIFFQNKDIAVILLDVMMPKMNGWQVLKTIREYSQVPVIMLTAKGEEQDELHGFDLGVVFIAAPLLQGLDQSVHLTLRLFVLNGQQHSGLDVNQMGSHGNKLAGYFQVHLLALGEPLEILVTDQRNGDVLDFHLIFAQKI